MNHLLNCTNCGWWTVLSGSSAIADVERECHEESVRTFLSCGPYCPKGSVAWATLDDSAMEEVQR